MNKAIEYEELLKQAKEQAKSGKLDEAARTLEQAKTVDDRSTQAYELLGMIQFHSRAYEDAVRNFERVTQLNPRAGSAFVNLGAVYNRTGDHSKAVTALRKGVQIDRKSAIGYYNLGLAHKKMNQLGLAVPAYREAIRIDPKMAEAYQNLGNVYLDMKNYQQATLHFNKALEINPNLEKAKRGLKSVENSKDESRRTASPFGRLVNTDELEGRQNAIRGFRTLSEEERGFDRQKLRKMLVDLRLGIQEAVDYAERQLNPAVQLLDRVAIQEGTHIVGAHEAAQRFQEVCDNLRLVRGGLDTQMDLLNAHQETIRQ